jgi:hypothetical protein
VAEPAPRVEHVAPAARALSQPASAVSCRGRRNDWPVWQIPHSVRAIAGHVRSFQQVANVPTPAGGRLGRTATWLGLSRERPRCRNRSRSGRDERSSRDESQRVASPLGSHGASSLIEQHQLHKPRRVVQTGGGPRLRSAFSAAHSAREPHGCRTASSPGTRQPLLPSAAKASRGPGGRQPSAVGTRGLVVTIGLKRKERRGDSGARPVQLGERSGQALRKAGIGAVIVHSWRQNP